MRESYSILCEFMDITNHSPDPGKVGQRISEIPPEKSRTTREFSNSMYLPTYDSKSPQNAWIGTGSWPYFFANLLIGVSYRTGQRRQRKMAGTKEKHYIQLQRGLYQDFLVLYSEWIPSCLIHEDLWKGNISTDVKTTGDLYINSQSVCLLFNAHHEIQWTSAFNVARGAP